ncbi:MAG: chromosome segregation ATPase [Myxococcota bacterium]
MPEPTERDTLVAFIDAVKRLAPPESPRRTTVRDVLRSPVVVTAVIGGVFGLVATIATVLDGVQARDLAEARFKYEQRMAKVSTDHDFGMDWLEFATAEGRDAEEAELWLRTIADVARPNGAVAAAANRFLEQRSVVQRRMTNQRDALTQMAKAYEDIQADLAEARQIIIDAGEGERALRWRVGQQRKDLSSKDARIAALEAESLLLREARTRAESARDAATVAGTDAFTRLEAVRISRDAAETREATVRAELDNTNGTIADLTRRLDDCGPDVVEAATPADGDQPAGTGS